MFKVRQKNKNLENEIYFGASLSKKGIWRIPAGNARKLIQIRQIRPSPPPSCLTYLIF